MAKMTWKSKEETQADSVIDKLIKRVDALEKEVANLKKKGSA